MLQKKGGKKERVCRSLLNETHQITNQIDSFLK